MTVLLNLILSGIAVAIAAYLTPGVVIDGYFTAVIVAVVLAIVNVTITPVLQILTLPLNIITL